MNYQTNRLRPDRKLILLRYPPFKTYATNQPSQLSKPALPKGNTSASQRNLHRKVLTDVLNIEKSKIQAKPSPVTHGKYGNRELGKENVCSTGRLKISGGSIEEYEIGKEIGRGAYAIVKECSHKFDTRKKYAVKIYEKQKLLVPHRKRNVDREIQILKVLSHRNIVRLIESIEGVRQIYLVCELVKGGSLYGYIRSKESRKLSEPEARRIFTQIVAAVRYCHQKGVVHRDLKLENILLDEDKNVRIIDFGFSVMVNPKAKLKVFCGTPSYMAPEIIAKKEYHGAPADVWSLGVILYAMLAGKFPFKGGNETELFASVAKGVYTAPTASVSARNLLSKLLNTNPMRRPTCDEIMEDGFVANRAGAAEEKYPRMRTSFSVTARNHGFDLYH
eukprot:TRINITY_DN2841_c0_g2_i1.p1 TRINITY_DN2841_c0_g2~~TRINITY_DN2841_c0_g2_i1.p1  ORF type:complete len:390 (+),score=90.65 TRINITY_DN2841_c0_g2_i1:111-1280(+)